MKFCGARGFSVGLFYGGKDFGIGTSDQNIVVRIFFPKHGADDFRDLLGRFAFGEDDFRKTLAEGAVMVHFGEAEVFKRQVLQALDGRARSELPRLHGFQKFQ